MKQLLKKWWFWAILAVVAYIVYIAIRGKACGVLTYDGGGPPTGSRTIYISWADYFSSGCVE